MGAPRRFLDGITNVSSSDPLGSVPYLDPTKWTVYFEDFCGPFIGDTSVTNAAEIHSGYLITGSANGTISLTSDAGAYNGCLKIVTTAADNESGAIQSAGGFVLTSGKKFVMETKFEVTATNVDENEFFIGLASWVALGANFFATNGTARTFDDGIGWYSPDGDVDMDIIVGENDVYDNQTVIAPYVTATWYTCTLYYDGTDIYLWVNGADVGTMTPATPPVSPVGPTVWFKSGEAAVHQLLVDYIYVAAER